MARNVYSDPNYWLALLNKPPTGTGRIPVGSGAPLITPYDEQIWRTQQDAFKTGLNNAIKNIGAPAPARPAPMAMGGGMPSATTGTATGGTGGGVTGIPDIISGGGYNPLAGGPAWAPGGGAGGGIAGQGLNVISGLLNQHPDTSEWDQTSAERAVAGGVQGSRMAAAEGSLLRQSEIDKRNLAGLDALQPFLNRQQQTFELIEKGRQAKDLLRLEQSGQMERLSAENKAKLEQIAAQGELALQETKLRGDYGLQEAAIGANTSRSNALLGANTSRENALLGAQTELQKSLLDSTTRIAASQPRRPSSGAQSLIDQILRGAGITPPSSYSPSSGSGNGSMYAPPPRTVPSDDYDFDFYDAPSFDDEYAYA